MCRHATSVLPPEPRSALVSRQFLSDTLTEWALDSMLGDAQLAVSELVTNAVMHAEPPMTLSVSCAERMVEIAVFDGSPTLPVARPHRADLSADLDQLLATEAVSSRQLADRDPQLHIGPAGTVTGGRGLLLVEALVAEWGVSAMSTGKAVWIRSPTPAGWPHAVGCRCAMAPDAAPLASGRFAEHRG